MKNNNQHPEVLTCQNKREYKQKYKRTFNGKLIYILLKEIGMFSFAFVIIAGMIILFNFLEETGMDKITTWFIAITSMTYFVSEFLEYNFKRVGLSSHHGGGKN